MFQKILKTADRYDLTILRITLGGVMFAHGAQKMLGWFGGHGFSDTLHGLSQGMSSFTAIMVIFIEFFGSLMLITGTLTRVAALGMFGLFVGIIYNVALPNGFFMNWGGKNPGEGYEYDLLVLGMSLALLIGGGGNMSVDKLITKTNKNN